MSNQPRPKRPENYFDSYPAQYPQEHVVVNVPSSSGATTVNKVTVPVVMVVVAAVFLMGITYTAAMQLSRLEFAIERLTSKMDNIAVGLTSRINNLEFENKDRWTKTEHEFWCARTEQINVANGWRCAEGLGERRREYAPKINGWEARK